MNEDDEIQKITTRKGRIFRLLSDTRAIVRWDDGSESEEALASLGYAGPRCAKDHIAHARRFGLRSPFDVWA